MEYHKYTYWSLSGINIIQNHSVLCFEGQSFIILVLIEASDFILNHPSEIILFKLNIVQNKAAGIYCKRNSNVQILNILHTYNVFIRHVNHVCTGIDKCVGPKQPERVTAGSGVDVMNLFSLGRIRRPHNHSQIQIIIH